MASDAGDPVSPRRIAVFRALQLGDLLCSVPFLRALREANPRAGITLVGLPWAASFVERFSMYVDDFIEFPGHPAFPERAPDLAGFGPFLDVMQQLQFDLAIQLHGSGEVANPILALFGAKTMAGFANLGSFCGGQPGFLPWPDDLPEINRYLALAEHLGFPLSGDHLEFPISREEQRDADELLAGAEVDPARLVVVHPGSQLPSRRWPAERFAAVARDLVAHGCQVVVTGTAGEFELTAAVTSAAPGAIDLAGRTGLGQLGGILARARLLVANDTGVSHVAAALKTPSVIVACGSDVVRWRPLDRRLHAVLVFPIECRPCAHAVCPIGHPCATGISVPEVLAASLHSLAAAPV